MASGKTGILLVAVLLLSTMAYPINSYIAHTSQAAGVVDGKPLAESRLAARLYIKKISMIINKTLALANKHNITIPEAMHDRINDSITLLERAERALDEGRIKDAVRHATIASQRFMPVVRYVWSHLEPKYKAEAEKTLLLRAIAAREMVLSRLSTMIINLNVSGPQVDRLKAGIEKVNASLEEARRAAENGDLGKAKIILRGADYSIRRLTRLVYMELSGRLHLVNAHLQALKRLDIGLERITEGLNETMKLIEEDNASVAVLRLDSILKELSRLEAFLSRVEYRLGARTGYSNYTSLLEALVESVNESIAYINASIESLEENNTNAASAYIALAVDTLTNATEEIRESAFTKQAIEHVRKINTATMRMRKLVAVERARVYSVVSVEIDRDMARLRHLLASLDGGNVSREEVVHEAAKTYRHLAMLKHSLGCKAPRWLIEKIDHAMTWIRDNIPEAVGQRG
ncbi:MAG: hypothetical protein F7C38_00115 [Desulfurococcales archaeon]|nr:hypothetical protein [Desulfurococcales archaeon]